MPTRLIEYRVHPDRVEENESLVREVFAELAQARLPRVSYRVLKGEGGRFVHLVSGDTAPSPITRLALSSVSRPASANAARWRRRSTRWCSSATTPRRPMPEAAETDFERWLAEMRPRLHRYCARMTGSAIDGEDAVQEALLKASRAFPGFSALDEPRAWLFRIAQHCALDLVRARTRRAVDEEAAMDEIEDPHADGQRRWVARTALRPFMQLTPVQRSCVILMDVLGYALDEIGAITGRSLPAVKAALHRGREALRVAAVAPATPAPPLAADERRLLEAYADRFNARDFDALRALLADEVRLELVAKKRLEGRAEVSTYFHNYAGVDDWRVEPGLVEGRPALLVYSPGTTDAPRYFVLLGWHDGRVATIRDFRYAVYAAEQADVQRLR